MEQCISSDTSVYVGSFGDDYRIILDSDFEQWVKYKGTGCAKSILANRISWFYDFSGDSVTIDTACSSGLVAVHLGCQNLRSRDSRMVSFYSHMQYLRIQRRSDMSIRFIRIFRPSPVVLI
jgi:acyl transferase domain-containing protein